MRRVNSLCRTGIAAGYITKPRKVLRRHKHSKDQIRTEEHVSKVRILVDLARNTLAQTKDREVYVIIRGTSACIGGSTASAVRSGLITSSTSKCSSSNQEARPYRGMTEKTDLAQGSTLSRLFFQSTIGVDLFARCWKQPSSSSTEAMTWKIPKAQRSHTAIHSSDIQ